MVGTETNFTATSLRQRLKRETSGAHQHLEDQLGLLNPGLDVHRYLLELGRSPADIAALPLCSDHPELSCGDDLAGCLYVLEGASLGGQVLSPLLHRRLGVTKESGAAFFVGDEESTFPRWTLVAAWIDRLPRTGASTTQIISAATATFDVFARRRAVARGGVPWST